MILKQIYRKAYRKITGCDFREKRLVGNQVSQVQLALQMKQAITNGDCPARISDFGFKCYSQFEEDGILLYLSQHIPDLKRTVVEACCGVGYECNAANLIVNHGWEGLLFEGDKRKAETARQFFEATTFWPPVVKSPWITADNINQLICENGFEGEIGLFSLDLDGVDYWVWKNLEDVQPQIVVLEINHLWGNEKSVTVPYDENFAAEFTKDGSDYASASLPAFIKLAREKGYTFVGANRIATNAFFIRNKYLSNGLCECDPGSVFYHSRAKYGREKRLPGVEMRSWEEV